MKIGVMELVVILIVALVVIGPDKLPEYARKLGVAMNEFRKVSSEMTKDIKESVVEPLEEVQRPLKEALEPLDQLNKDVQNDLKQVENDFKNIGKEKQVKQETPAEPETEPAAASSETTETEEVKE